MTAGLGGESGEVLEILKKSVRDQRKVKLDKLHLTEELGDVLYYVAMIAEYHGIKLSDVVEFNVSKINHRYKVKKSKTYRKSLDAK